VLFFIELQSRRVHLVGSSAHPSGRWVAQQARNLVLVQGLENARFLIHDRDSKLVAAFDEVFRSEGISVILTPFRAPRANAHAERFVRTARTECLDWLLIFGPRQLDRVLRVFVEHSTASARTGRSGAGRQPRSSGRRHRSPVRRSSAGIDSAASCTSIT
jgi:putative transposase